jgi:AsmA protein
MKRRIKIWAWVLLTVIAVPVIGIGVFLVTFDPNAYAPDLISAMEGATGRQMSIGSRISIALSFTPTIQADNVSLANPPGFPDADFLTLRHVEARIALLPLFSHRVDIQRLWLDGPVLTLETSPTGAADWDFSKPTPPSNGAGSPSGTGSAPSHHYKVTLESVEILSGQLIIKNPQGAQTGALTLTDLTGAADSASTPLNVDAAAAYNGIPFTVTGRLGPIERFSGIGSGPWPVDLSFAATGATATVNGTFSHPRSAGGYDLAVTAAIPALTALQPLAGPAFTLPPVQNLTAAAHLTDQNAALPAITALFVKAGASDLSTFRPGLSLQNLDIEMPSLSQPLTINITGAVDKSLLSVSGSLGAVASLLNPAWLPPSAGAANPQASAIYPVNLTAQAAGATLAITGGAATPNGLAGVALGIKATIPDLSALAPLAGTPLPAWKNIALQTTVIDPGGLGLAKAAGLDGLTLTMDNAALGGGASLYFGPQPKLEAAIKAQTINIDALRAAMPAPQAAPVTPPSNQITPVPAQAPDFTQSTTPLPVKLLQSATADIQISADTLILNHATYAALQTHAVLGNGVLTISPFTAILPGGGIAGNAAIDVTKSPPTETVTLNAPALALSPFLKAIGLPDDAQGTIQAALNANGAGLTPHDFFAGINGSLGLASVNGVIDGTVLDDLFGAVLHAVGLPEAMIGAQGPVPVRCFALRMDAAGGTGTIRALTLDSSRLLVQGGGGVNFGNETLGVIIRPQLRVAGAELGVPVKIGGTFYDPTTTVAPLGALQEAGKTAIGLPITIAQDASSNSVVGQIIGGLGLKGVIAKAAPDVCPDALALGRLGAPGPAAEAPAAMDVPSAGKISGPQSLLNVLLGK